MTDPSIEDGQTPHPLTSLEPAPRRDWVSTELVRETFRRPSRPAAGTNLASDEALTLLRSRLLDPSEDAARRGRYHAAIASARLDAVLRLADEEQAQLRAEVARLASDLSDAKSAVERVEDLQEVWERTEPQTLMSRRRAAAILNEVVRP